MSTGIADARFRSVSGSWQAGLSLCCVVFGQCALAAESPAAARFEESIQPILIDYCYRCHGDGIKKGNVSLDSLPRAMRIWANPELWWSVLKNVRAGIMPPAGKPRPTDKELSAPGGLDQA